MKTKNIHIEIWRIIFTVYIFMMHGEYLYRDISHSRIFEGGFIGVEFFFIVSGYFIVRDALDNRVSAGCYIKKRISSLYPNYILSMVIMFIISIWQSRNYQLASESFFVSVFGLQHFFSTGTILFNSVLWYVTFLFWFGIVIFLILRKIPKKTAMCLSVMYILVFYIYAMHKFHTIDQLQNIIFFMQYNAYRAIADMLIGVVAYEISKKRLFEKWSDVLKKAVITVLMLIMLVGTFKYPHTVFNTLSVFIFVVTILISNDVEYKHSKINAVITGFSKHMYSVYCYQLLVFWIFEFCGAKGNVNILVVFLSCILVGILFDYFVVNFKIYYHKIVNRQTGA